VRGEAHRADIVASASVVFVLPFLLFSHASGVLADRLSKRSIIVFAKWLELAIMLLGCLAVRAATPAGLYGILFLMCAQSALFGPSKYGIVPEIVGTERLSRANGLLVGCTYLAAILGTFIPSWLLDKFFAGQFLSLALVCVGVAVAGLAASFGIARTRPQPSAAGHFTPLFFVEVFRTVRDLRRDRELLLAVLGSGYFLFIASFLQQNVMLYGSDARFLGLGWIQSGYLFPVAALGIGAGGLLAGRLSGRNVEFGVVPVVAMGLMISSALLGVVPASLKAASALIFASGVSAGLFIVPLDSFVQARSPAAKRGEIIACSSFLGFLGVALSAGLLAFLTKVLGFAPDQSFIAIAALTAIMVAAALIVLPDFFVRFVVLVLTRAVYRIRTIGAENLPAEGGALLVSNHVTWVDALLLTALTPRRIRFLMDRQISKRRFLRHLFRLMKVIPISAADSPHAIAASLKTARQAMDDGYMVCVFAEGALTRNGNLRAFRPGFERIVKDSAYPIIPIYIGGAWGSIFSYYRGRMLSSLPRKIPYPIDVLIGASLPATSSSAEVRQAVLGLSGRWFDLRKSPTRTLAHAWVRTARRRWFRPALSDTSGMSLTYGGALTASVALAAQIERQAPGEERIGLLLPSSVGGALANVAAILTGRVPVNLNFTWAPATMAAVVQQSGLRTIITSRTLLKKLGISDLPGTLVFLEDLLGRIGAAQKAAAALKALLAPARWLMTHRRPGPDDLATIIFSSGSTGSPKGAMLTHHNVLSNIDSFDMILHFRPGDVMAGVLPFFHSFGFTCTLWCPLLSGFAVHYHPSPLETERIAGMVREKRATALLSTPTFLLSYMRRATREDFATLRIVVAGAEKLKPRVADAFEEKFGIRPLEGYGATELSPVVAISVPDVEVDGVRHVGQKPGSIGHPIPGVCVRVVDPQTGGAVPEGGTGELVVKGPNVMAGYLNEPAKTAEVLRDGWYHTGDVARVDEDGFVFLVDRLSRYSKIGGEMVPHLAVEEKLNEAVGAIHQVLVVTAAEDEKKGEQLVVLYSDEAGDLEALCRAAAESDLPNLWKPRRENFFRIDGLPMLASGKLDLRRLRDTAKQLVAARENGA
jgi:acyl-[acyl-carrier-protein]-phospholipid O-acyltransferase/long-chain-fatty-acid--[acyl-carrier-protein] ligase